MISLRFLGLRFELLGLGGLGVGCKVWEGMEMSEVEDGWKRGEVYGRSGCGIWWKCSSHI